MIVKGGENVQFSSSGRKNVSKIKCEHNARCRYTTGFYCEDCNIFFNKDSPTYRSGELLSSIWMTLHNIGCDFIRKGKDKPTDIVGILDEIGIGEKHENYEEIIARSEVVMKKYAANTDDATVVLN